MKNLLISTLFLFTLVVSIQAQRDDFDFDDEREETLFNRGGGIRFTGLWGAPTNSIADFGDDYNISTGGNFTFEINGNFLIGWAGYKSDVSANGQDVTIKGNDLFLGYTFRSNQVVHPVVYLQGGSSRLEIEDVGSDRVFVLQPTIGAEINIARFFRLGIDGGYRYFSGVDLPNLNDKDFAGPVLNLRLKFGWSWGN